MHTTEAFDASRPAAPAEPCPTETELQAMLLTDHAGRVLYAAERPGSHDLRAGAVVGRDWRELFSEFEEIQSGGGPTSGPVYFVNTAQDDAAYRVWAWETPPAPGGQAASFVFVEQVGDTAALDRMVHHERMAALGQVAAGVAHEVNNPLTTVSGWLQMLLAQTDENDKLRAPLSLMNDEVQRIAGIVAHLLSFGRETAPEEQVVRVNDLIADVLTLVEYQMRSDNIDVVTEFDPNLPDVAGDPNQLKQVFLNLVVNAREAMPVGGMLTITTGLSPDGSAEIAVADTGPGMAPEVAEKVFSPFYTTKEDGSGIGLFLCTNIVNEHGGDLSVSSRPGDGTTFVLTLPCAAAEETAARQAPDTPAAEHPHTHAEAPGASNVPGGQP
jgi:signal transduction histidine kinase